ncbi:MAG: transcriptional regulator [Verrucomicrobiae bacterium]|nr:transcriptional regulator [Verrucomicrobiae bacterium]
MDPEAFRHLDRVIHEKGRLAIMSLLAANPELSYTDLRALLQMTDGNLTTHLRTLQEAGYVVMTKSTFNKRPLTTLALSEAGRRAFAEYLNLLEKIVQDSRAATEKTGPPD